VPAWLDSLPAPLALGDARNDPFSLLSPTPAELHTRVSLLMQAVEQARLVPTATLAVLQGIGDSLAGITRKLRELEAERRIGEPHATLLRTISSEPAADVEHVRKVGDAVGQGCCCRLGGCASVVPRG